MEAMEQDSRWQQRGLQPIWQVSIISSFFYSPMIFTPVTHFYNWFYFSPVISFSNRRTLSFGCGCSPSSSWPFWTLPIPLQIWEWPLQSLITIPRYCLRGYAKTSLLFRFGATSPAKSIMPFAFIVSGKPFISNLSQPLLLLWIKCFDLRHFLVDNIIKRPRYSLAPFLNFRYKGIHCF